MSKSTQDEIKKVINSRTEEGCLTCAQAFSIAEELGTSPQAIGRAADEIDVRLVACQLGLFGYGEGKRVVHAADTIPPELERAIREGLILDRLPCAVAWSIAKRFGIGKRGVADTVEALGIRISQCQLGAF